VLSSRNPCGSSALQAELISKAVTYVRSGTPTSQLTGKTTRGFTFRVTKSSSPHVNANASVARIRRPGATTEGIPSLTFGRSRDTTPPTTSPSKSASKTSDALSGAVLRLHLRTRRTGVPYRDPHSHVKNRAQSATCLTTSMPRWTRSRTLPVGAARLSWDAALMRPGAPGSLRSGTRANGRADCRSRVHAPPAKPGSTPASGRPSVARCNWVYRFRGLHFGLHGDPARWALKARSPLTCWSSGLREMIPAGLEPTTCGLGTDTLT
jgi:hypothetical protein